MNRFDFYLGEKNDNPLMLSALLVLLVFIVYLYQGLAPAFNADDVVQVQYPEAAYKFLEQGRWGYFLIFGKLFQSNPVPIFATVLGSIMLVLTGIYACQVLGFRRQVSVAVLVAVSSVSVYYGELFSYDSTRIAYPIANLLAIYGFYLTVTGKQVKGILLMSMAPAFYPVAAELVATLFVAFLIVRLADTEKDFSLMKGFFLGMSIIASLMLYALIARLISKFLGFPLGGRTEMDMLAALHRSTEILSLITKHSFPILSSFGPKLPVSPRIYPLAAELCIFALFVICITFSIHMPIRTGKKYRVFLLLMLHLGLVIMPFVLIFASKDAQFPSRSFYSFALVHGFYAAFVLEKLLDGGDADILLNSVRGYTFRGVLVLVGFLLFFHAAAINMRAFDEYLASRSEILMANRIYMRIENTIAENPQFTGTNQLKLAVINNKETYMGPRGYWGAAMHTPWSKERIFHFLDRHIVVADQAKQEMAQQAALTHGEWPAKDSVFILDDLIVVVIHK